MPNYACLNIKTYKSLQSIRAIQAEATREKTYTNIDSGRTHLNRVLLGDIDYVGSVKKALKSDYYTVPDKYGRYHKKPEVLGVAIILQYSKEAHLEDNTEIFERWITKNIEFIKDCFPYADAQMILHADEVGYHIHTFLTMTTPTGKISKNYYIKNKNDLRILHDKYAEYMSEFGLVRGESHERQGPEKADEFKYYKKLSEKIEKLNAKKDKLTEDIEKMKFEGNEIYNERIIELENLNKEIKRKQNKLSKLNASAREEVMGSEFVMNDSLARQ